MLISQMAGQFLSPVGRRAPEMAHRMGSPEFFFGGIMLTNRLGIMIQDGNSELPVVNHQPTVTNRSKGLIHIIWPCIHANMIVHMIHMHGYHHGTSLLGRCTCTMMWTCPVLWFFSHTSPMHQLRRHGRDRLRSESGFVCFGFQPRRRS